MVEVKRNRVCFFTMSETRSVASVLIRVSQNTQDWDKLAEECQNLLQNVSSSVFLHGAAAIETPPQFLSKLGLDPQTVAVYSTKLVENGIVARKQYQRVLGEHTRVQTYDLLGENSEGYARVLCLLTDVSREPELTWKHALQLIGEFSLEPFKVMSLWVAILLNSPDNFDPFVEWVKHSMWNLHPDWPAIFELVGQWKNLSKLAAKLVAQNVISFLEVYAFVDPKKQGFDSFEVKWRNVKTESSSNALTMAMPLVDNDDEDEEMQIESPREVEVTNLEQSEDSIDEIMQNCFVFVGDLLSEIVAWPNTLLECQIIALLAKHPLTFGTSEAVARGLSELVAAKLPEAGLDGIKSILMSHAILEPAWSALCDVTDLEFFRKYMLPSIDLHPHTQPFLWTLDSTERYALYTDLHLRVADSNPLVKARFAQAEKDTKDILKRLTKQDAEALIVPQLLEVFARCPWPSLNVFINQVENYNIGQLVAKSSASQIAPLAMDMLPLILMQQFTVEGRTTKQLDGLFDQKWFKLLAQFAGDVAVAYETFDFVSLIKLVLQQIAEHDYSETIVIDQLVRRLSGIPSQSNLSVTQLIALHTAEPVSSVVAAAISEQYNPQRLRLVSELKEANLLTDIFLALAFAHKNTTGQDAKVIANRIDQLTSILLTYTQLLEEPLDPTVLEEAGVNPEFVRAAVRNKSGSFEFWNLQLYDIELDQDLYSKFKEVCDAKSVERASLSHRLRVKSVRQQLENAPKPSISELVSRLVLSPADALYTSRYMQVATPEAIPELLSRNAILAVLRFGTPLEAESFACFMRDILSFCYTQELPDLTMLRKLHCGIMGAILEAAHPEAAYTPLSNTFSLVQRSLLVFPMFEDHGISLVGRIQLLTTKLQGDLETSVKSLSPQLTKRASLWQSKQDVVKPEFIEQIVQNNERLMARLVSSVQLVTQKRSEKVAEPIGKNGRRIDMRKKPRGKKNKR